VFGGIVLSKNRASDRHVYNASAESSPNASISKLPSCDLFFSLPEGGLRGHFPPSRSVSFPSSPPFVLSSVCSFLLSVRRCHFPQMTPFEAL